MGTVAAGSTGVVAVAAGSTAVVAGSTGAVAGSTIAGSVVRGRGSSVGGEVGRGRLDRRRRVRDQAVGQPLRGLLGVGGAGVEVVDGVGSGNGEAERRGGLGDPLVREAVGDPGAGRRCSACWSSSILAETEPLGGAEAEPDDVEGDDPAEQDAEDDDPGAAARHPDDEAGVGDPADGVDRQHRDVAARGDAGAGTVVGPRRGGGRAARACGPVQRRAGAVRVAGRGFAFGRGFGRGAGRVRGEIAGAPIRPPPLRS